MRFENPEFLCQKKTSNVKITLHQGTSCKALYMILLSNWFNALCRKQSLIESKLKKYFYLKNFYVKHFSNSFIHKICGKRMRIQKRWKNFLFFSQSVGKARRVYLEQKFLCVLINQKLLKSYGLLKTENLLYCRKNFLCIKSQSMLGIFYYAKQRIF